MSAERTIVVSGAGSGIGRAVTERLVADGGWVTGQVLSPNGGVVLGR